MNVGGNEAGDVGHVRQEESPDLVGDLTERPEVEGAWVGAGSGQDHTRSLPERDVAYLVVVDIAIIAHAVVDEVVGASREVELHPVREVPAVGEVHGQNLVARVEERRVSRLVGLAPRVRLHVHVLGTEESLRPFDGEVFHLVYLLAAAVVALAWIALSVLVCEHRALSRQDGGRGKVLAGDELYGVALAFQLTVQRLLHLDIDDLGVWSDQNLP